LAECSTAPFRNCASPFSWLPADGVGTKLKIAFLTGVHDTIGRDLVNHCVNDILVQGARPLFFLDYIAYGQAFSGCCCRHRVRVSQTAAAENGCVLLGGETAEMPGFYADGEYDVAGFIVGVVDRDKVIDGKGDYRRRRCAGVAVSWLCIPMATHLRVSFCSKSPATQST
jgi:phosphoribosylformylglycinamidine cyclo-ligase